jgi:3-hydroxyacyl-CoA dehydrogenase
MNVTIIGAGNMGRGIGHRLVAGGHSVTIVDRDPEEAEQLAEELRSAADGGATVEAAGRGAARRGGDHRGVLPGRWRSSGSWATGWRARL